MIVVDLGCATRDGDNSILPLIRRYKPDCFFGFDPGVHDERVWLYETQCEFNRSAAWTHDGQIEFANGARSDLYATVTRDYQHEGVWQRVKKVPCFDFAAWLLEHDKPTVVKMNIEGAEFELLEHIIDQGADRHVQEWLIQWHDHHMPPGYAVRRRLIQRLLSAPVREWGPADIHYETAA